MLNYVTVEHVHASVIGELKLELESFAGIKVPGFLHRFVGITGRSISTDALLRDVVNVHGMGLVGRICEDPLLGGAQRWLGVNTVGIEPLPVDRPMPRCLIKAPIARYRGLPDIWHRKEGWRDRAVVDDVLSNTELKQQHTGEHIREIEVLS